jgi:hypothetical protein
MRRSSQPESDLVAWLEFRLLGQVALVLCVQNKDVHEILL